MSRPEKTQVLNALRTVIDPELGKDLVSLNMVKDVDVAENGAVSVTVELTTPACPLKGEIECSVQRALMQIPGVTSVTVNFSANVPMSLQAQDLTPGVRNIIGIASAKGGVGKSTVAANLATALARLGASVGLLDADIYGPNIPGMFGLKNAQPEIRIVPDGQGGEIEKLVPVENFGVRVMSMGFLVDEDQPIIWRGPMLHSALRQFLGQVEWGDCDYLIIDLPPGTGDIQISLIQLAKISGVVHVTTPQEVALQDVRKGIVMFRSQQIPLLGIIENMSYFVCPHCGQTTEIFSRGGAREVAEKYGVPFLGEIPLTPKIRQSGDEGVPCVVADPDSEVARRYLEIAGKLAAQVSVTAFGQKRDVTTGDAR